MGSVLVVARDLPHPPDAGDRIVTWGFLRGLAARGHDVHLLAGGTPADRPRAETLRETCATVTAVDPDWTTLPARARKLRNAVAGRSDVMQMFTSDRLRAAATAAVRTLEPDVVLAEHPYVAQHLLDGSARTAVDGVGARVVTNAHVVEYRVRETLRRYAEGRRERLGLALETPRLRREELSVYRRSDRTLVLGAEDGAELERRGVGDVAHQPVGLDVESYRPREGVDPDATDLLFFGSYGWFPNEDAARAFATEAFPWIRERRPDAEFVIAGRNAPPSVAALDERPGVRFVGEVADLGAAVRDAALVVAPLRIGGGTRLKVLESMAWGAPVVTTEAGFEGVDARPGEEIAVAADWEGFVDRAVALLDDPDERRRIGANARAAVADRYAIPTAGARLEANLGL